MIEISIHDERIIRAYARMWDKVEGKIGNFHIITNDDLSQELQKYNIYEKYVEDRGWMVVFPTEEDIVMFNLRY
jgi:hypothetical protein